MKITLPSPANGSTLIHLGILVAIAFAASDIALAADSLSQSYQAFTTKGLRLGEPRFSPDSEKLVFHQCSRETCEILLLNIATNQIVRIRPPDSHEVRSKSSRIT